MASLRVAWHTSRCKAHLALQGTPRASGMDLCLYWELVMGVYSTNSFTLSNSSWRSSSPHRRRPVCRAVAGAVEGLERRALLAVTASFNSGTGQLSVSGDALGNNISVSRNAAGTILVNGGAVAVIGGVPTVANTSTIQVFGLDGSDVITFDEGNGALPAGLLFGGNDNDVLTGGSGSDQLFGQAGNDTLFGKGNNDFLFGGVDDDVLTGGDADDQSFGENGNDRIVWNPGDDTDLNEGGAGTDTVEINGGNGAEIFATSENGTRVRFDRLDPAAFSLDIGTSENLVLNANGGNDSFTCTGNLAALIAITADGGAGNDTLLGSNGADVLLGGDNDDFVDGNQGNDTAFLGAGNDVFQWDPGDGSDIVEGQADLDNMLFNGSAANENMDISANGGRVRFTRDIGSILMDVNDVESITVNLLGGTDRLTVNNMSGTDLTAVDANLASSIGGAVGDGASDTIIVNGTGGSDVINVLGAGTAASVVGLAAQVNITNTEGANDALFVNALAGTDSVTATSVPAGVINLTLDGGTEADSLLGSQGADTFLGGDGADFVLGDNGNDAAFLGAGADLFEWDPGDGSDVIEGQADADSMLFFGSNAAENVNISANGGRTLFTRDVAAITMDMDDVELVEFRALGGADNMTVGDLSGTGITQVVLNLAGPIPGGDAASDSITVTATQGADNFAAGGSNGGATVSGLSALVMINNAEAALDQLVLNGQGGDDVINSSSLAANAIALTQNGGLGNDLMIGGVGGELFNGGDGNDAALMGAGNDSFVWNPGDDNDIIEGQADQDRMVFNGANLAERVNLMANGGRVLFTRDIASVVMDMNDVEQIDFNALGGADSITVDDIRFTDITSLNLNLLSSTGTGDGVADTLTFNGSAGADLFAAGSAPGSLTVNANELVTIITGLEPSNEVLNLNGLAGADTFTLGSLLDAAGLKTNVNFGESDGSADQLIVSGTSLADTINVADSANSTAITGISPVVQVFSAEAAGDSVRVNALGGADAITVNGAGAAGSVNQILIDGGTELDTLSITNTAANGSAVILPSPGNDNVSVNLDGLFQANAIFRGTQRIGALSLGTNGLATIESNGNSILTMSSLVLNGTAKLNIANNHAIIDYPLGQASPFSFARARVITGFNGGAWNGNGIISSAAAVASNKAIGYAEASALFNSFPATFQGQSIDNTSVLLSFTFKGDFNLDRVVGFDDLLRLSQNYGTAKGNWADGDFTYSGAVNFDDLLAQAQNYNAIWLNGGAVGRRNDTFASTLID